jgi:hypothetical protein
MQPLDGGSGTLAQCLLCQAMPHQQPSVHATDMQPHCWPVCLLTDFSLRSAPQDVGSEVLLKTDAILPQAMLHGSGSRHATFPQSIPVHTWL